MGTLVRFKRGGSKAEVLFNILKNGQVEYYFSGPVEEEKSVMILAIKSARDEILRRSRG